MECVKCGAELEGSETECPSCGVIVSKARATPPPQPPIDVAQSESPPIGGRQYYYMVAPFHGHIRTGQGVEQVSSQLQEVINHYAAYGWEFVQIGTVSMTISRGCLASLFGSGPTQLSYDQVIFRQPVANG